ncbi:hypothetical protein Goari_024160, partial [Gossypium aridum]|nr:hypothetical protein [Gossypium aridum]
MNKLLTNEERTRRGITFFSFCEQCGKAMELAIHVVRYCNFTQTVWKSLVPRLNWNVFFNLHVGCWVHWNITNEGNLTIGMGEWPTFFLIGIGFLWKSRNDFIFDNANKSSHELIAPALAWEKSFVFNGNREQLACFSKTEQGWQRSEPRWIKINVDGSVSISSTKVEIEGAVRDLSGVWLVDFNMVTRVSDAFQIEARVIIKGLKLVWPKGFKQGNKVADSLAKTAVRQFNQLVVITDPPQYVRSPLEED